MSSDYAGYLQARTGFEGAAARVTGDSGSDVALALCPASEHSPAAGGAGTRTPHPPPPPPFLLCYSDLRCEYYDVELGYEQLREARDADPSLKTKGWGDVFRWLAASLRANTVDASWVGAADGGASAGAGAEVMTLAFRGSELVFDLRSHPAPPEAAAACIARLALHLAAQAASSAAALAEAQAREQHLNALLHDERQKNATLRQAVAAAAAGGGGGGAAASGGCGGGGLGAPDFLFDGRGGGAQDAQGSGAGHATQGHKRKIHSLVNPAAKVRRPRGTRLGGS